MIKVYQIQLTNAEADSMNRGEVTEKSQAYFSRMFDGKFKPEIFEHYTHVANVASNDMEEAFELMNLWNDQTKVEKLGRCSSMSVGDIVEMENGSRYRCASFGFEEI